MVLSAEEEISVAKEKHKLRVEFENLRHKNEMEELEEKLDIACMESNGVVLDMFKGGKNAGKN